jgi:hypothetical protein
MSTPAEGKARRTPERGGQRPGAKRASASDGGGRLAADANGTGGAEAALSAYDCARPTKRRCDDRLPFGGRP